MSTTCAVSLSGSSASVDTGGALVWIAATYALDTENYVNRITIIWYSLVTETTFKSPGSCILYSYLAVLSLSW